MGYYSELTIDGIYYEDRSYPSPELQLKWRIEDLRSKLEDITKGKHGGIARRYADRRYSKDDLSYTPPEYFCKESDIMDAIALAEEKLALMEKEETEHRVIKKNEAKTEGLPGQLELWDIPQVKLEALPPQHEFELKIAV